MEIAINIKNNKDNVINFLKQQQRSFYSLRILHKHSNNVVIEIDEEDGDDFCRVLDLARFHYESEGMQ